MLSKETIEAYRRMTPGQHLELTLKAIREAQPYLLIGPAEVVRRRFARLREENDARNRRMLEGLAAAERRRCQGLTK
jgi:hypothetical protein